MRPAVINIVFAKDATVMVEVETNAEALLAGIGPQHDNTDDAPEAQLYRSLRELPAAQLADKFAGFADEYRDGLTLSVFGNPVAWRFDSIEVPAVGDTRVSRKSLIRYRANVPDGASEATFSYAARYGDAVVSFASEGEAKKISHWLVKGERSPPYPLAADAIPRSWMAVAVDYTELGFLHILPKGLDHILFVLGLFLLSTHLGPLLWQVTAFTIAHSITLALSIYGYIELSASIVEPLIALSIAYVGLENVITRKLHSWRVLVVFIFGLLHGMGFAGVLLELGLPESEFVTALVTFNIGVELGQIAVILLALLLVFRLRRDEAMYRLWVVVPGSLAIAAMGLYWTAERLALF